MNLKQSIVVVTGAARGIGRAIASGFAERGAAVALSDVLEDDLHATVEALCAAGRRAVAVPADVSDFASVEAMADRVRRELGPVDVLVNNAGTFSCMGPVWEADPKLWRRDTQVNLFGAFHCVRALVPGMVERGGGVVVNIVAAGGVGDPHAFCTSYAVSKTALMRLTEGLAQECQPHGVRVYALAPPGINSRMTEFIARSEAGRKYRPGFAEAFDKGFDTRPEDVADWCLVLAEQQPEALAGRFVRVTAKLDDLLAKAERIRTDDLLTLRLRDLPK